MAGVDWIPARDQLKLIVQEQAGISFVHGFPRLDPKGNSARWRKMFSPGTSSIINAWTIERRDMSSEWLTCQEVHVFHTAMITGFYQHSDENASQDAFDAIIDGLLTTLFGRFSLGGTAEFQGPAQLIREGFEFVNDTLCHLAEITATIRQRINVSSLT